MGGDDGGGGDHPNAEQAEGYEADCGGGGEVGGGRRRGGAFARPGVLSESHLVGRIKETERMSVYIY